MEIRTVTTLRRKRDEIERAITIYEKRLVQARADLAHIDATIAIFEAAGDAKGFAAYVDVHRLFQRGEAMALCKAALAVRPMTTRQLALHIMEAKGMDTADAVLTKAVASRIINALGQHRRRGSIIGIGQPKSARIWRL